jgi:glycosyltransferase involved in cell wall biosynthesis
MAEPLVFSVVVPVHNKAPHVGRAIESVLAQTHKNFELIIIDDASSDGSRRVIDSYTDSRVRVLSRDIPGPGGYAARNLGVQEAQNQWVAFLDADDAWQPDHLARCAEIIAQEPTIEFIGAGFIYRDANGEVLKVRGHTDAASYQWADFGQILTDMSFCVPSVVIQKQLLTAVGGFPAGKMTRGGDIDTWLRVMEKAETMILANHCAVVVYLESVNRVTQQCIYTENEIRNDALAKMIGRHNGDLQKKLKKFYNQAIVFAWQQNWQLGVKKNFSLARRLYLDIEPIKYGGLTLVSMLPGRLPYKIFTKMLQRQ